MPVSEVFLEDCMIGMKRYPDKFFDLAIVDPPYGINKGEEGGGKNWKDYKKKDWDSKNQIVWGANYYPYAFKSFNGLDILG